MADVVDRARVVRAPVQKKHAATTLAANGMWLAYVLALAKRCSSRGASALCALFIIID